MSELIWAAESGGSRKLYYIGCRCPAERGTFGVSARLQSVVKQGTLGVGKKGELYKEGGGLMLMICTPYDMFLCKELPFWVSQ